MVSYIIKNVVNDRDIIFFIINILFCIIYIDRCRFKNKRDKSIALSMLLLPTIFLWGFILKFYILNQSETIIKTNMIFFSICNLFIILSHIQKDKLFRCWNSIFYFLICTIEFTFLTYSDSILVNQTYIPNTYEGSLIINIMFIIILIWFILILSDKFIDFILKRLHLRPDFDHIIPIIVGEEENII